MKPYFNIEGRQIGYDFDPLVIADLGINHGGSLKTAFEMVDAAAEAGVEVLKHQTHVVEDEMTYQAKNVIPGHTTQSIYEIMADCALSEAEERELKAYVEKKGMIFMSTPFSRAAALRLESMEVTAYKIGSGECNNYPLVEVIAGFNKPVILSTGMNTIQSIRRSVEILRKHKTPFSLLHCTNIYPTPPHLVRLGAISELMSEFPDAVLGLSDHTTSNYACLGAVALGASILERHFTDSMQREGPDIINSMDPAAARDLIEGAKILKQARGGRKGPVAEEQPTIDFAYASVVTIKRIKKGERFSSDNLWVKRPGTGPLFADSYQDVLGLTAACDLEADHHLCESEIEGYQPKKA